MNKDKKTMKTRNIFAIIMMMILLVPLTWHSIAPMSLCWLQSEQIGINFVSVIVSGIAAIIAHVASEE